ncbi:hypothetical protein ES703_10731 [subsurface metagenome]
MRKVYEKDGNGVMAHLVPDGKSKQHAIIMVAAYTKKEAEEKLNVAIDEAPPRYAALIKKEGII